MSTDAAGPAPRAATLSAEDYAVIDVVLTDLLKYKELRTFWDHKRNLVLFERKPGYYMSKRGLIAELSSRSEKPVPTALVEQLVKRNNEHSASFVKFKSGSARISVAADNMPHSGRQFTDAFETGFPDARAYVKMYLPAFSKDGRAALVRFGFGPTPHGATGTYYLERENGRWIAVWRDLAYYV